MGGQSWIFRSVPHFMEGTTKGSDRATRSPWQSLAWSPWLELSVCCGSLSFPTATPQVLALQAVRNHLVPGQAFLCTGLVGRSRAQPHPGVSPMQSPRKSSPGGGQRRGEAGILQAQQGRGWDAILDPQPRGGSKPSSWASPCYDFSWGQWGDRRPSAHDLTTTPASSLAQADTSVGGYEDSPSSPHHTEPSAPLPPEPCSVLPQTRAQPCC